MSALPDLLIEPIVRRALEEDLGRAGDITTSAVVPPGAWAKAALRAREAGRIAGLAAARIAFHLIDDQADFDVRIEDGEDAAPGDVAAIIEGSAASLLAAERVALNFACHLSGVATATAKLVAAVRSAGPNIKTRVTGTRKTTPGLRILEKQAVALGGGFNHRFGLDDAMLIKDNHIVAAGGIRAALAAAKARAGHMVKIEIEVDTLDQLEEALAGGADAVLLDNMSIDQLIEAVMINNGRAVLEASGGITLETAAAIARTGVDYISSGAITHSAPSLDLGLDFEA